MLEPGTAANHCIYLQAGHMSHGCCQDLVSHIVITQLQPSAAADSGSVLSGGIDMKYSRTARALRTSSLFMQTSCRPWRETRCLARVPERQLQRPQAGPSTQVATSIVVAAACLVGQIILLRGDWSHVSSSTESHTHSHPMLLQETRADIHHLTKCESLHYCQSTGTLPGAAASRHEAAAASPASRESVAALPPGAAGSSTHVCRPALLLAASAEQSQEPPTDVNSHIG